MTAYGTRNRSTVESHLKQALRHVAVGQRLIDKQRALVATLEAHGHPTRIAKKLLLQLEEVQTMHVADRDRLIVELSRYRH